MTKSSVIIPRTGAHYADFRHASEACPRLRSGSWHPGAFGTRRWLSLLDSGSRAALFLSIPSPSLRFMDYALRSFLYVVSSSYCSLDLR